MSGKAQTKPLADQSERDRATGDLDTTFLVEAAAGTGKTTILVERILSILRAGRASLRQIAAITFTEKAAGELKVRLRQEVERELRESGIRNSADSALRIPHSTLQSALADLEGMSVNTIHAFCSDLIRERPVEARVEPGFAVADELGQSLILEEAWEDWLAEQMSGDAPAVRRAVESGIPFEAAGLRESPIFSLACELIGQRDAVSDGLIEPPWTDAQFAEAAENIRKQIAELIEARKQACLRPDSDGCAVQIAALQKWAAELRSAGRGMDNVCHSRESGNPAMNAEPLDSRLRGNDIQAPATSVSNSQFAIRNSQFFDATRTWLNAAPPINSKSGQQGNWSSPAAIKSAKANCALVKDAIANLSGEVAHRVLHDLVEWLRPFLDRYRAAKDRRRALDFADLLLKARDMLRDSRAARDYFKRHFRCILVDEFQDTDPLQAEIVFFLSERPDEHAADWEAVNLVPGKLFIVGDPKQSIYRFRRADLDLYGKVRAAVARQGEALQLSVNFRTVPRITGEVNRIFEPLMLGPVGERFEPKHVALDPYRKDEETQPCVLVPLPPKSLAGQTLKADDWRRKESGCIAAFIAELVKSGRQISAGKQGGRRAIQFRDIAVLYRTAAGLDSLEDSLRANDVPYQVSGGRHYYARMEFQDLLSVLKAIDNPFDGLSVVGALRSPFFGQSDEDLLRHFGAGGKFNYLEAAPAGCRDLAEAFDALKSLHERRRRDPASAVLAQLFEDTRALQVYAMKPHGEQRVANLLKLQEIARAMAEADVSSFSQLVRWLGEMESSRQAEAESPVAEADENFVQVMTIHKAKGLEFPVVVLAHLANEGQRRKEALMDRAGGRLHLNLSKQKTRGWDAAKLDDDDRAEHEARRMFYVALTRARDLLVIPAYWSKNPQAEFLKYLGERYAAPDDAVAAKSAVEFVATDSYDLDKRSRDTLRLKPTPSEPLPPEAAAAIAHHEKWQAGIKAQAELLSAGRKILTGSGMVQSADNLVRSAECRVRSESNSSRADEPFTPHSALTTPHSKAAALGTLVHHLMEIVDFKAPGFATAKPGSALATPGDLTALAEAEARELGLTSADAGEADALVQRALAHPLIARAAKAEQLYREVPFAFMDGDTLYEGYADLVFIENGEAVIVDYKTDTVTESEAPEHAKRYGPQADVYLRAISAALGLPAGRVAGQPVKEFHFLFIRPGVAVPHSASR